MDDSRFTPESELLVPPHDSPLLIGEAFVGTGPAAAHLNLILGPKDGPVGIAWATALATPSAGHAPFMVVVHPDLPVLPNTLFVSKSPLMTQPHSSLAWGAAQAGVAAGIGQAAADQVLSPEHLRKWLIIAAVWVDPAASVQDAQAIFENNSLGTHRAVVRAFTSQPPVEEYLSKHDQVWNPYFTPST